MDINAVNAVTQRKGLVGLKELKQKQREPLKGSKMFNLSEALSFKGESNKYLLNFKNKSAISMCGLRQDSADNDSAKSVELLRNGLAEELEKHGIKTVPDIDTSGFIKDSFLLFKPYKNEIVVGKVHLNAIASENGQKHLDDYIKTFTRAIVIYNNHKDSIDRIYKESANKLGYGKDKLPELSLIYLDINTVAANFRYGNLVILNSKWLEKATEPELLTSVALSHELSHFKTQMLYRGMKQAQKSGLTEKSSDAEITSNVLGRGYDQTIERYYSSKTKGSSSSIYSNRKRRILDEISKKCNLELYEVSSVDLLELLNGKVTFKDSHQVIATFDKERKANIAEKLSAHQEELKEIFRIYRLEDTLEGVKKEYTDNPDEILSRHNQVKITREHILDGTVKINDPEIRQWFLNVEPEQPTDEDYKDIHSACRI